jgi:hypothetical protein
MAKFPRKTRGSSFNSSICGQLSRSAARSLVLPCPRAYVGHMPAALKADWNLAQALVLQGLPFKEVAVRVGVPEPVLRKRSWRGGWLKLRTQSVEGVAEFGAKTLAERSKIVRDGLADELADQVNILRHKPPKNPSELGNTPQKQGRTAVAKMIAEAAARTFDWGEQQQNCLIAIGLPEPSWRPEDQPPPEPEAPEEN